MAETLNTGDYADLRREIKNKEIGTMLLGSIGAALLVVAIGAAIVASGGGAALPLIGGLGSTAALATAAVAGIGGAVMSWKAMQSDIELRMDYEELRARRSAANLSQALGTSGQPLTPQQSAAVSHTMQQNVYPQNQRADGKTWSDTLGATADAAIIADAATDISR